MHFHSKLRTAIRKRLRSLIYIYMLQLRNNTSDQCVKVSIWEKHAFSFDWMIFLSGMDKCAQVSAWLCIHLCSCSQIQSRHFWFDWTTKGPCDGWKMRRALTCHFNPPASNLGPILPDPCLCSLLLGGIWHPLPCPQRSPPVPHPHVQPVTSLPSPLGYTSLLQRSNSRTSRTPPACINSIMACGHYLKTF